MYDGGEFARVREAEVSFWLPPDFPSGVRKAACRITHELAMIPASMNASSVNTVRGGQERLSGTNAGSTT